MKHEWTPVALETILHCYYNRSSPGKSQAVRQAIAKLRLLDMIETRAPTGPDFEQDSWATTEKGNAFVEALCAVPEPVAITKWEIPKEMP